MYPKEYGCTSYLTSPCPLLPCRADFGYLTLAAGFEHGILHCIRFSVANQAWIIYETDTGRSGMVGCLLLLPIVLPMRFDFFKKKVRAGTNPSGLRSSPCPRSLGGRAGTHGRKREYGAQTHLALCARKTWSIELSHVATGRCL